MHAQAPCCDGLDWSHAAAARLELSLQQLFSLLGGDPDAYSACMAAYASELARRVARQPPLPPTVVHQAGAAAAGEGGVRGDNDGPAAAKKKQRPGWRDQPVNDGVDVDEEPGVARLLGVVGSYAGLGLVLRAMLAQEAEAKPAGGWVGDDQVKC